jgi:hypothetical protein
MRLDASRDTESIRIRTPQGRHWKRRMEAWVLGAGDGSKPYANAEERSETRKERERERIRRREWFGAFESSRDMRTLKN